MESQKTVLHCGQLFTSIDETVYNDMAVTIDANRITAVAPMNQTEVAGAKVIDLSDKFVMPGLIDSHLHVNMDGKPLLLHQFMNENSIGDLTVTSIKCAQADLFAGFTTIRDEGAAYFTDVSVKKAINCGKIVGPRMFVSGMPLTATGGHADSNRIPPPFAKGESLGLVCDAPDAMRAAARYNLKYGADQIKIMATGGVMSFGDDPKCSEFSFEEMKAAIEVAKSRGRITSAHAHGRDGIKIAVKAGITSIEHGMLMDDECIDLMKQHGVYLIPTIIAVKKLVANKTNGIPAWMADKAEMVLSGHYDNIQKCRAAGIVIGFGSDAGSTFNFHGKQTLELEYMHEFGFSPAEALIAATRINATMMQWESDVGTIETGKYADIIAYSESPLRNLSTVHNVSFVMKDGQIVKVNGKSVFTLNENA